MHPAPSIILFTTISGLGLGLLALQTVLAQLLLAWLAGAMVLHWVLGDSRFAASGSTLGTATGLGARGSVRMLEPPHTGTNYLLREMAYVVARRHVVPLWLIALFLACVLPSLVLWSAPHALMATVTAVFLHMTGMLASRWLFFAQAEHVVGLCSGIR